MSSRDPCNRAGKLYQEKKYQEALRAITQCKKEHQRQQRKSRSKDYSRTIAIAILEGNILYNLGKIKKANTVFKEALLLINKEEYFKSGKEKSKIRGKLYYSLALTSKNADVTISHLIKAREDFKNAKLYADVIECTIRLIYHYRKSDQKEKLKVENSKLLKLAGKLKEKKSQSYIRGQAYTNLGQIESDYKSAMKYFTKAEKEFTKAESINGRYEALFERGRYMLENGGEDEGRKLLQDILEKTRANDLLELETKIKYALGIESIKSGNLDDAATNIIQALSLQAESDDPQTAAMAKLELARIRFSNGNNTEDYEIALNLGKSALDTFSSINNREGMALSTELVGNIYVIQGKSKLAFKVLKRSKNYYTELDNKEGLGRVYTIIADAASIDNNSNLILSNLGKAEKVYRELKNVLGLSDIYQRYAIYYIQNERDRVEAQSYIHKLKDIISADFPNEVAKQVIVKQVKRMEEALEKI